MSGDRSMICERREIDMKDEGSSRKSRGRSRTEQPDTRTVLLDTLQPGLRVTFCGTAVGPTSARVGVYYAGPGNQFWDVLFRTGLTPRRLEPHEFKILPRHGIGLTDLAKKQSGTDDEVDTSGFDIDALRLKIARFAPKALAFNGKRAARAFFERPVAYGRQPEPIGQTTVFVLPSTSGAARGYWDESFWRELAVFAADAGRRKDLQDKRQLSSGPVTRTTPSRASRSGPKSAPPTPSDRLIQRAMQIDALIIRYFRQTGADMAKAKDLMPVLVRHGGFRKDHREGYPLRKLCNELHAAGKLSAMTTAHFDQKAKNKNWYFLSPATV